MSDPPSLRLSTLEIEHVRNLTSPSRVEPGPRLNVVYGDNGQGKSSLLEAIYLACTSKSFRTSKLKEVVAHGRAHADLRAIFAEHRPGLDVLEREQRLRIAGARALVRIDGNRPSSLAAYATRSPVVVFHPEELRLSTGPAALRRRLLDRIALFVAPASARHLADYARALRERQELLRRGVSRGDELAAFERLAADLGASITQTRARVVDELAPELLRAFARIADPTLELRARYEPGGSADPNQALVELELQRTRDAHRPTAGYGPHRDELQLSLGDHPARLVASQGQHRAVTLALKAAESALLQRFSGLTPIQLLDDVSSELDPTRSRALYTFLREAHGQVFLTTPRPELVEGPFDAMERKSFRVVAGRLEPT